MLFQSCQCAGTPTAAAGSLVLQPCRSPSDVQREYLRQWKEVTARDGTIQPQTILSTLWFVPVWFKYNATPYILRYLVYCVWMVIKAAYFRWHTAMVLRGAPRYRPRKVVAYRGDGLREGRLIVRSELTCTQPASLSLHGAPLLVTCLVRQVVQALSLSCHPPSHVAVAFASRRASAPCAPACMLLAQWLPASPQMPSSLAFFHNLHTLCNILQAASWTHGWRSAAAGRRPSPGARQWSATTSRPGASAR